MLSMVLEVDDLADLEEWRSGMETSGWKSLIQSMGEALGEEPTEEMIDESILFYGVQAWPLPTHP